jgi:hypothetical protein
MRVPTVLGFIAGSWLVGAAVHAASWWDMGRATNISYFIPLVFAIAASGNVHQPSPIGFLVGMVVQWTLVGLIALAIYYGMRRIRASDKHEEP